MKRFTINNIISIIDYHIYNDKFWKGKKAILSKSYSNFLGETIEKGKVVRVIKKMQYVRFNEIIHNGSFAVKSMNKIKIYGIDYQDLYFKNK